MSPAPNVTLSRPSITPGTGPGATGGTNQETTATQNHISFSQTTVQSAPSGSMVMARSPPPIMAQPPQPSAMMPWTMPVDLTSRPNLPIPGADQTVAQNHLYYGPSQYQTGEAQGGEVLLMNLDTGNLVREQPNYSHQLRFCDRCTYATIDEGALRMHVQAHIAQEGWGKYPYFRY